LFNRSRIKWEREIGAVEKVLFYPLSNFPHGGKVLTPSPVGEGWEGGLIIKKLNSNLDYLFN